MIDYRKENKYIISFSNKFLLDFCLDKENFIKWIKKYVNSFYLKNKPQMYSLKIWDFIIRFHKIDIAWNNKGVQKWNRVIVFFVINNPNWFNTIYPAFAFSTQKEKIYNQKLKTIEFVKSLRLKLEKYNIQNENNIEFVI